MRKADLLMNHKPFDEAITRYRELTKRVLRAQRIIKKKSEKNDFAESVILRLCANWERFIDNHLTDCVNVDPSQLSTFLGVKIPPHPDCDLCQALLFGDGFRDFRSYGDLIKFSKKVLPASSNPFPIVSLGHRKKIDEVYKIRNYLAHYSSSAKRSLDTMYKGTYKMKKFYEPGFFILANGERNLWGYFDAFEGASNDMKNWY